jgi:ERCC4-type nuclease
MTIGEFYKRLLVLQFRGGLVPWFTRTSTETLRWIEALYRTWTDVDLDEHKSHLAIYTPPSIIPISDHRQMLRKLPGVGTKTSGAIIAHFGSLGKAFASPASDWEEIDGIGRKTARAVVDFIEEEFDNDDV